MFLETEAPEANRRSQGNCTSCLRRRAYLVDLNARLRSCYISGCNKQTFLRRAQHLRLPRRLKSLMAVLFLIAIAMSHLDLKTPEPGVNSQVYVKIR